MIATEPRVALVTGAARGIGAATVAELCRQGYRVVAVDSCDGADRPDGVAYELATTDDLERVVAEFPDQAVGHVADVRSVTEMRDAVATAVDTFGRLDAAVAAAGVIAGGAPLWETSGAALQTLLDVNLVGVWNTASAAIPLMVDSDTPSVCRFVAVASAAAENGLYALTAYNASKHAVIGLVRGLAADLVDTGVTAVAVSPGSTRTEMLHATAALYSLDDRGDFARQQLIRRLIEPSEIAATIGFCCSATGAVLDGSVVNAEGGFGQ